MTWNRKIPFDKKTGNPMHYVADYQNKQGGVEWRDNYEFDATFHTIRESRGRSSVVVLMKDDIGKVYEVSLSDFMSLVPNMVRGTVFARWSFAKRGQNFFCAPIEVYVEKSA